MTAYDELAGLRRGHAAAEKVEIFCRGIAVGSYGLDACRLCVVGECCCGFAGSDKRTNDEAETFGGRHVDGSREIRGSPAPYGSFGLRERLCVVAAVAVVDEARLAPESLAAVGEVIDGLDIVVVVVVEIGRRAGVVEMGQTAGRFVLIEPSVAIGAVECGVAFAYVAVDGVVSGLGCVVGIVADGVGVDGPLFEILLFAAFQLTRLQKQVLSVLISMAEAEGFSVLLSSGKLNSMSKTRSTTVCCRPGMSSRGSGSTCHHCRCRGYRSGRRCS